MTRPTHRARSRPKAIAKSGRKLARGTPAHTARTGYLCGMSNTKNLKQWPKGRSGNPKGRPRKTVPDAIANVLGQKSRKTLTDGLSYSEVKEWEAQLMTRSPADLVAIAKSQEVPVYASANAAAILADMKCGRTVTLDKLRERRFGKVPDKMELTGKDGHELMKPEQMDTDEILAEIEQIKQSLDNET